MKTSFEKDLAFKNGVRAIKEVTKSSPPTGLLILEKAALSGDIRFKESALYVVRCITEVTDDKVRYRTYAKKELVLSYFSNLALNCLTQLLESDSALQRNAVLDEVAQCLAAYRAVETSTPNGETGYVQCYPTASEEQLDRIKSILLGENDVNKNNS